MDLLKRMDMGGALSTMAMSLSTMLATMSMALSSLLSTMSMASSTTSSSDMDMSSTSMNMYLTSVYKDYPVLFKTLSAKNGGQAFGIFLLIFVVSFLSKGFEFLKIYLEQKVWKNPNYAVIQVTNIVEECACDDDKTSETQKDVESLTRSRNQLPLASVLVRDFIRLILCFIPELLSYAMMLVAMSFSLVYFFAVVTGMSIGRFFFERLCDNLSLRPGANNLQGHH